VRAIVTVVVAVDSPAGRAAEVINDMTAHLPPPDEPHACPMYLTQSWSCPGDAAAYRVITVSERLYCPLTPVDG
jgi:hypothetical protein